MIKKLLILPLIIFILLLILLLSSYSGVYNLNTSITENDSHLSTISLANSISSYVKRAETHFYLYLMLDNKVDRDKFFTRMQSLEKDLNELKNSSDIDIFMENKITMQYFGKKLINAKDDAVNNNINFPYKKYEEELASFYTASSTIRKTGVLLVEDITSQLKEKRNGTLNQIKNIHLLLLFSGLVCIVLIILMIKKRSDELEQSKKITHELDILSNTDDLTDIGNRRSFDATFKKEWERSIRNKKPIALMMIDVDCFKLFNDNYGHIEGDECLTKVAQTLHSCMKRPADSVWRYGGEEFAAILPDTDNAIYVAENCRKAIEQLNIPHALSPVKNVVTVSIGIGIFAPDRFSDLSQFIDTVDKVLYRAKNNGRNQVCTYLNEINHNINSAETKNISKSIN